MLSHDNFKKVLTDWRAVQSSWLSSLPFLSQYVFAMLYGSLADFLLQRGVHLVTVRKISVVVCKAPLCTY